MFQRPQAIVDRPGFDQRALGYEEIVAQSECGQILADQRHHPGDGKVAHRLQPLGFGSIEPLLPVSRGQRPAGFDQVLARVEPVRDRPDRLAQSLAIAQMGRAGEQVHLRAGVVDVVLALDPKPGFGQQCRERIADHGAAAVADMHRPGRVGRNEFDIDPLAAADRRIAKAGSGSEDRAQLCVPNLGRQP